MEAGVESGAPAEGQAGQAGPGPGSRRLRARTIATYNLDDLISARQLAEAEAQGQKGRRRGPAQDASAVETETATAVGLDGVNITEEEEEMLPDGIREDEYVLVRPSQRCRRVEGREERRWLCHHRRRRVAVRDRSLARPLSAIPPLTPDPPSETSCPRCATTCCPSGAPTCGAG